MFKIGDIVKCTKSDGDLIIKGNRYIVISSDGYNAIKILNERSIEDWYIDYRFILDIKYIRKQKVKRILCSK